LWPDDGAFNVALPHAPRPRWRESMSDVAAPAVTVVVSSRNRPDQLAQVLPSVVRALGAGDRAVVVDSASDDDRTAAAAAAAGLECIRLAQPGLSRARNAGVRAATTDVVAFTDDDCFPSEEWLDRIRAHFTHPRVGFVTGQVTGLNAGEQSASVLERGEPARYSGVHEPYGIGHGANMSFRRTALVELGLFDEELGSGAPLRSGEDADMLLRFLAAGWDGVYDPAAVVSHDQWRDPRELVALRYGYGLGNGAYRVKSVRRGHEGPALVLRSLWRQGVHPILWATKRRNRADFLSAVSWTRGMLVGIVRGARRRLDGPNFQDTRWR
jgi:glycosyltransferase involved in cell wall biosynthesis